MTPSFLESLRTALMRDLRPCGPTCKVSGMRFRCGVRSPSLVALEKLLTATKATTGHTVQHSWGSLIILTNMERYLSNNLVNLTEPQLRSRNDAGIVPTG